MQIKTEMTKRIKEISSLGGENHNASQHSANAANGPTHLLALAWLNDNMIDKKNVLRNKLEKYPSLVANKTMPCMHTD